MRGEKKTKKQLSDELADIRERVIELEELEKQRKLAEDTLRESEERFRTLYRKTPVIIHSIDANRRLVDMRDQ